ncbi:hypothetical protein QF019_002417 [Pseudomonas frederiksbergensis]|uniref:hypothetical protein n=1 Tax=Pseudomonas frederiksbergensis TaxID=104087 RepID=UPI003D196177
MAITDADWSLTKDVFTVVGTVFAAIGVTVASYVGLSGLKTWRRQIRGNNDHELSRRMLVESYRFKKSFFNARGPAIYPKEVREHGDPVFGSNPVDRFNRQKLGFQRRIESFNKEFAALSASMFEAEALWGQSIVRCIRYVELLKDEYEDYISLKLLAIDPEENEEDRHDYQVFLGERRAVLKSRVGDADEFGDEMQRALGSLESLLKTKLVS